jgi:hypothetical protein
VFYQLFDKSALECMYALLHGQFNKAKDIHRKAVRKEKTATVTAHEPSQPVIVEDNF